MPGLTDGQLALRREIMAAFADTGEPLAIASGADLRALAEHHVVVLSGAGEIVMAHPFAAHRDGARVDSGGRTWWGNCAWDALGIAAVLDLSDARVTSNGVVLALEHGRLAGDAVFQISVPASRWWDDIAFT